MIATADCFLLDVHSCHGAWCAVIFLSFIFRRDSLNKAGFFSQILALITSVFTKSICRKCGTLWPTEWHTSITFALCCFNMGGTLNSKLTNTSKYIMNCCYMFCCGWNCRFLGAGRLRGICWMANRSSIFTIKCTLQCCSNWRSSNCA